MRKSNVLTIVLTIAMVVSLTGLAKADLDDGLLGYWRLDETAGATAADSSPNGNNGAIEGGVTLGAAGLLGTAFNLNGADGRVDTGLTASALGIGGNASKTVTAWVNTETFNNGGIFDLGNTANGQQFSLRTQTADNSWRVQFYGGAYDFDFTYASKNTWVFFAITHNEGDNWNYAYADGGQVGSRQVALNTADNVPFRIGSYSTSFFDGSVDEVGLWDRALSPAEITQLYNSGAGLDFFAIVRGSVVDGFWSETTTWGSPVDPPPVPDATVDAVVDHGGTVNVGASIGGPFPAEPVSVPRMAKSLTIGENLISSVVIHHDGTSAYTLDIIDGVTVGDFSSLVVNGTLITGTLTQDASGAIDLTGGNLTVADTLNVNGTLDLTPAASIDLTTATVNVNAGGSLSST